MLAMLTTSRSRSRQSIQRSSDIARAACSARHPLGVAACAPARTGTRSTPSARAPRPAPPAVRVRARSPRRPSRGSARRRRSSWTPVRPKRSGARRRRGCRRRTARARRARARACRRACARARPRSARSSRSPTGSVSSPLNVCCGQRELDAREVERAEAVAGRTRRARPSRAPARAAPPSPPAAARSSPPPYARRRRSARRRRAGCRSSDRRWRAC